MSVSIENANYRKTSLFMLYPQPSTLSIFHMYLVKEHKFHQVFADKSSIKVSLDWSQVLIFSKLFIKKLNLLNQSQIIKSVYLFLLHGT